VRDPGAGRDGHPRVGVVVLTHDRCEAVVRTLAALRALPESPPLVVVDNGSSDPTAAEIARRFPDVDLVVLGDNRGAAGRNAGVARLRTPYVAFCDDDAWWAPGALARAAALLDADPRLAVVTGRVLIGPDERPDPACAVMAASPLPRRPGSPTVPVLGFLASASVFRREAFLAAGGFEPRFFLGSEEELLALDLAAAGWWLGYADDVVVHHHPSPRRDSRKRRRLLVRNALWTAWLRRPLPAAAARTVAILRDPQARGLRLGAAAGALLGLAWVLHRRRPLPPAVEAQRRLLDARDRGAPARPAPPAPSPQAPR
jgi:GT2 family glycosyltransferase